MPSLYSSRGIALHVTDYSETSVITKIYTEQFGMQAYMLNGVKRKKSKVNLSMLQPMTLLEMNVYHKQGKRLQRVSEMRCEPVLNTLALDMNKTSAAFLMSEVISKTVHENEPNKKLFGFIFDSVLLLDSVNSTSAFTASFLLHLTSPLGFFPQENFSPEKKYFNLKEGQFVKLPPSHPHWLNESLSELLFKIIKTPMEKSGEMQLSSSAQKNIQAALLMYYRLHLEGFKGVRSQKVLEEVWSEVVIE